jgi:hypothetical protein
MPRFPSGDLHGPDSKEKMKKSSESGSSSILMETIIDLTTGFNVKKRNVVHEGRPKKNCEMVHNTQKVKSALAVERQTGQRVGIYRDEFCQMNENKNGNITSHKKLNLSEVSILMI